jgi:hypothetical protein
MQDGLLLRVWVDVGKQNRELAVEVTVVLDKTLCKDLELVLGDVVVELITLFVRVLRFIVELIPVVICRRIEGDGNYK